MASVNVQPYTVSNRAKILSLVGMGIGIATLLAGAFMGDHERVWTSFLTNLFYFTSLALGGLFFTAIQFVSKAGWSSSLRRLAEALTSFLPFAFVAALIFIFVGSKEVFEWLKPEVVAQDPLLQKKEAYLNFPFFLIRTVVIFALWFLFAKLIIGNSLKQDSNGDSNLTIRNVKYSVIFLIVFALSYSLFSVDFAMSADPHWFSTIFGVYCFAGLFQSTLSLLAIMSVWLIRKGLLKDYVNENHLHDIGKFMFAFTVFYAYIAFSQFMLIWYANLPEETIFYIHRMHGGWFPISLGIVFFKFLVPFFLLLPRAAKRNGDHLVKVGVIILLIHWVDVYWLIYPNFNEGFVKFGLWEIGLFLGFLGLFAWCVTRFLSKNKVMAVNDPYLHEALHHHI